MDTGRRKQFDRIEKDVIAGNFDARDALGMKKVGALMWNPPRSPFNGIFRTDSFVTWT
jgi:hypothetical protein